MESQEGGFSLNLGQGLYLNFVFIYFRHQYSLWSGPTIRRLSWSYFDCSVFSCQGRTTKLVPVMAVRIWTHARPHSWLAQKLMSSSCRCWRSCYLFGRVTTRWVHNADTKRCSKSICHLLSSLGVVSSTRLAIHLLWAALFSSVFMRPACW